MTEKVKKLISDVTYPVRRRFRTWLVRTEDKPKQFIEYYLDVNDEKGKEVHRREYKKTHTKFPCVGGKYDGQLMAEPQVDTKGYVSYNRSYSNGKGPQRLLVYCKEASK